MILHENRRGVYQDVEIVPPRLLPFSTKENKIWFKIKYYGNLPIDIIYVGLESTQFYDKFKNPDILLYREDDPIYVSREEYVNNHVRQNVMKVVNTAIKVLIKDVYDSIQE